MWLNFKQIQDVYPILHRTPDKLCGDSRLRCMTDGHVARVQPRGFLRTNSVGLRQQKLLLARGNLTGINSWSTVSQHTLIAISLYPLLSSTHLF